VYFKYHHDLIQKKLSQSTVAVACNQKDEDQVYGYLVFEVTPQDPTIIFHYCYIKAPFRRFGLAEKLIKLTLEQLPASLKRECSHTTAAAMRIINNNNVQYNPYSFYF
jgi:hypothetical protein